MKEPQPMREVHEVQEKIYEEEKNLSIEERLVKRHREVNEFIKRSGLKFNPFDLNKVA